MHKTQHAQWASTYTVEFYSTHFHTIICDGSFINHSFKSLIVKIGIYVYDVLR